MSAQPATVLTMAELRHYRDQILEAAACHGANNVRVFGSVARGEAELRPRNRSQILADATLL